LAFNRPGSREVPNGHRVSDDDHGIFAGNLGVGRRVRCARAKKMNWVYVLSAVLAVGLLIYLVIALFRAEDL
jgi:K+-transporting ATPase KdpF subunit